MHSFSIEVSAAPGWMLPSTYVNFLPPHLLYLCTLPRALITVNQPLCSTIAYSRLVTCRKSHFYTLVSPSLVPYTQVRFFFSHCKGTVRSQPELMMIEHLVERLAQGTQVKAIYLCFPHDQNGWTLGPLLPSLI